MGRATETEHINAARKQYSCSWCAERIDIGQPYKRWRWYADGDATTCRMHPECYEAMEEAYREDPRMEGFCAGDNPRGCNCGYSNGCQRCEARKVQTHNTHLLDAKRKSDSLRVIQVAADFGGVEKASSWFESCRLPVFDNKTPCEIVAEGHTDDLLRYMHSLEAGFCG
jgi:hypothetical protein